MRLNGYSIRQLEPKMPARSPQHASSRMIGLDRLAIGDRARVVRIIGADEITARLFEMGLTPGVAVALLGCAPLGDPIELEIARLSLEPAQDGSGSR